MKLYSLNKQAGTPCMIVKMKDLAIMIDCALDLSSLMHFLPVNPVHNRKLTSLKPWTTSEVKQQLGGETNLYEAAGRLFVDSEPEVCAPEDGIIDFSSVDVILLTNYKNFLALPYVTEYCGFTGKVYATDPTLQLGRLFMEELVSYNEARTKVKKFQAWKNKDVQKHLSYPLCDQHDAASWQAIYTPQDVQKCISKIQAVGFDEKVNVLGLIQVTAASSGHTIGSCNWVLQTPFYKVSCISSSSTYATHSKTMDQEALKESDLVLLNCLTEAPVQNPDAMIREFCSNIVVTLKNGGNVLVPCFPAGVIYDLLEYLCGYMDGNGLNFIPIYFISPVAKSSLAYANIYAEWLNVKKQSQVYLPEPPFSFQESVRTGRIKHFSNLHDSLSDTFKSPCLVFTGHPSLRFGDAVHFIELWGNNSGNTVIFIEPDFPYLDALQPYQPMSMKAVYCPIDPRLNFSQANKLLKELRPRQLLVPETYTVPPMMYQQRTDLTISVDLPTQTYRFLDIINVPINKSYVKVLLDSDIAEALCPKEVEPGVAVASVKGVVVTRDNQHVLKPVEGHVGKSQLGTNLFGDVNLNQFLQALEEHGIKGAQTEETDNGHIVHIPQIDAMIQVEPGNTHIINHSGDEIRVKIRDALLSCLMQV